MVRVGAPHFHDYRFLQNDSRHQDNHVNPVRAAYAQLPGTIVEEWSLLLRHGGEKRRWMRRSGRAGGCEGYAARWEREWKRVWWPVTAPWLRSGALKSTHWDPWLNPLQTPYFTLDGAAPNGKVIVYLTTLIWNTKTQEVLKTAVVTIYIVPFWSEHTRCPSSRQQTPCRWGMRPFTSCWPSWKLVSHFLLPWLHSSAAGDDKRLQAQVTIILILLIFYITSCCLEWIQQKERKNSVQHNDCASFAFTRRSKDTKDINV